MADTEPAFALNPSGLPRSLPRRSRSGPLRTGLTMLGILALLGGALYLHGRLSRRPLWTVGSCEISGNRSISTAELLDRIRIRPGMPWWRVSTRPAARLLAAYPRIRDLRISWSWPRELRIAVVERESVLRIRGAQELEVAEDGTLLDPNDPIDPADLPLLTGELPSGLRAGGKLTLVDAQAHWDELLGVSRKAPDLWKQVSQVHAVGNGEFQIFLRQGHKVLLWPAGINAELKEQIPTILAELRQQHLDDAVLDLRFRDQVVVRLPEGTLSDTTEAIGSATTTTDGIREKTKGRRGA
jgi:cell division septal protein FtsQ